MKKESLAASGPWRVLPLDCEIRMRPMVSLC